MIKNLPAQQETHVPSLDWEYALESEMATHSSILAGKIPWTEKPGRCSPWGHKSQTRSSDYTTDNSIRHSVYDPWLVNLGMQSPWTWRALCIHGFRNLWWVLVLTPCG